MLAIFIVDLAYTFQGGHFRPYWTIYIKIMMHEDYHINYLNSINLKAIQCDSNKYPIDFENILELF